MEKDRGPWIRTYTGISFYLFDPQPQDIRIEDIAAHLSVITRFGGALGVPYSVAAHSLIVSYIVDPSFAFEGLMHDAAEYVIGDVVRPWKLTNPKIKESENHILKIIAKKYGFLFPIPSEVDYYDKLITKTEAEMCNMQTETWTDPAYKNIGQLTDFEREQFLKIWDTPSYIDIREHFLDRFNKLYFNRNRL